jgi:hypothetical protein
MNFEMLWKILQVGNQVQDPATWKDSGKKLAAVAAILGLIFSLLPLFGVHIDASPETITEWAGALITLGSLFHIVMTAITSRKVGLVGKQDSNNTSPASVSDTRTGEVTINPQRREGDK